MMLNSSILHHANKDELWHQVSKLIQFKVLGRCQSPTCVDFANSAPLARLLTRAHPTGIGTVYVHLFWPGNKNETAAGFEPWLSQVWGKWGKQQTETQNISASESLEMGKGDKLLLCSTAIGKKEGEKLLRFSYFWTGKAEHCDHSHCDYLQFKKKI